ncbi:McrC family protein [Myxococcus faecalis]|uniref:McrC family protein n=1 Tax=Myxococcus faecalis TaxID=3115646 RepID=UPI0024CB0206|nr:restriction endonuclease [Myxococcus sp. MH1]
MATTPRLVLREWETAHASDHPVLHNLWTTHPDLERDARRLREGNALRVEDGRQGVSIKAQRHVGVVRLGPLHVTVQPRLAHADLWYILEYGLGIDRLDRPPPVDLLLPEASFADLIALALLEKTKRLSRRGPRRGYARQEEWLSQLRGRIDITCTEKAMPLTRASLPCIHHILSTDIPENRMVRAGLKLAAQAAYSPGLKAELAKLERSWSELCGSLMLDTATLRQMSRELTRLTADYAPILRLITLLHEGRGMSDTLEILTPGQERLPGFLWDMASLFERFVERFLREHLKSASVSRQKPIEGLYEVVRAPRGFSARNREPRPDILLEREGQVVAVLDTKYKDFKDDYLDRNSLYQMSVYAVAHAPSDAATMPVPVIVLYPRANATSADDVVYAFKHGRQGRQSPIIVRGIDWSRASQALRNPARHNELATIAEEWTRTEE